MGWAKFLAALLMGIIQNFLGRLRRDQEMKEQGREEVITDAHAEADQRVERAESLEDDWRNMSADQRERLRESKGHYRD